MEQKPSQQEQAKKDAEAQAKALIARDTKTLKAIIPKRDGKPVWSEAEALTIRDTVAKGASTTELALFLTVAARCGLDPFIKQIHFVKRWDSKANKEIGTFQTGIDGSRLIAQRSGMFEGESGPFWCGEDGIWKEVWLDKDALPAAAKVGIFRKGFREPMIGTALYKDYVQKKSDGTPNVFWKTRPEHMLAKCAEALALRKAFPQDLSGIHVYEEMGGSSEAGIPGEGPIVDTTSTPSQEEKSSVASNQTPTNQPQTPQTTKERILSEGEIKTMAQSIYKIAAMLGIKEEELKPWIYRENKVESTKKLSSTQFNTVINYLKSLLPSIDGDEKACNELEYFKNTVLYLAAEISKPPKGETNGKEKGTGPSSGKDYPTAQEKLL